MGRALSATTPQEDAPAAERRNRRRGRQRALAMRFCTVSFTVTRRPFQSFAVSLAMSSPIFFGDRPSGPILGASEDAAPTSPPSARTNTSTVALGSNFGGIFEKPSPCSGRPPPRSGAQVAPARANAAAGRGGRGLGLSRCPARTSSAAGAAAKRACLLGGGASVRGQRPVPHARFVEREAPAAAPLALPRESAAWGSAPTAPCPSLQEPPGVQPRHRWGRRGPAARKGFGGGGHPAVGGGADVGLAQLDSGGCKLPSIPIPAGVRRASRHAPTGGRAMRIFGEGCVA